MVMPSTKIGNPGGGAGRTGKLMSSVLHTLRCGDKFFSTCTMNQPFIEEMREGGGWAPWAQQLPRPIFMD